MDRVDVVRQAIKAGLYPTKKAVDGAVDKLIGVTDYYERGYRDAWFGRKPVQFGQAISPMAFAYSDGWVAGVIDKDQMGVRG